MADLKPFRQAMERFCFINRFRIDENLYVCQCLSTSLVHLVLV